jgi:hypothetical protein
MPERFSADHDSLLVQLERCTEVGQAIILHCLAGARPRLGGAWLAPHLQAQPGWVARRLPGGQEARSWQSSCTGFYAQQGGRQAGKQAGRQAGKLRPHWPPLRFGPALEPPTPELVLPRPAPLQAMEALQCSGDAAQEAAALQVLQVRAEWWSLSGGVAGG